MLLSSKMEKDIDRLSRDIYKWSANKMYVAAKADSGVYRGSWVVVRKFDGALWSEDFGSRQEAELYATYLNGLH